MQYAKAPSTARLNYETEWLSYQLEADLGVLHWVLLRANTGSKKKSQEQNILRMAKNEVRSFKKERKTKGKNYLLLRNHCLLYAVSAVVYMLCIQIQTDLIFQACNGGFITQKTASWMLSVSPRASLCPPTEDANTEIRKGCNIRCQSCLHSPWAGLGEGENVWDSVEAKHLSMFVWGIWKWWEGFLAAGGPVVAICLSVTRALLPGVRQI